MGEKYFCEKCKKTLDEKEFYQSNNKEKYADGKLHQCKKCLTMHVDNWDPDTFLWILQECDVPWIPEEWNKLMKTFAAPGKEVTGTTIIGRYLSKMKLKQHKDYRWKDTAFLQELSNSQIEQTMKRQGYSAAEIAEVIQKGTYAVPDKELAIPEYDDAVSADGTVGEPADDYFANISGVEIEQNLDLTDEDKKYLYLKWGKSYKPEEWVKLEQLYNDMMASYDIQGAGHEDTLKLVCKTSLKCNQLIDIGDVEGYQKMSKVYNDLMKSGKFQAAQRKEEQGEFVDSVGELIEMCEKQGYIERFYIDQSNDKVDETIKDMQRYTRTLIMEETNLGNLIENALRENAKEDAAAKLNKEDTIIDSDDLSIQDIEQELKDTDYEEFNDFQDKEAAADAELLNSLIEGEK